MQIKEIEEGQAELKFKNMELITNMLAATFGIY